MSDMQNIPNGQENVNLLFSPGTQVAPQKSSNIEEYQPTPEKGTAGVYKSVIRVIPWWKNPVTGSMPEKYVSYLIDPVTEKGKYIDCPSSVGKPDPIQDIFFKLKKSESIIEQNLSKSFGRRKSYASLIQIIKDDHNPELNGKIMIWRYGIKIWEKINSELNPAFGDKHDPFDLIEGKAFSLVITKVTGQRNYDQSKFIESRVPFLIKTTNPDGSSKLSSITHNVLTNPNEMSKIFEYIKTNSPDLDKYAYKDWDADTSDYVNHVIRATLTNAGVASKYGAILNRGGNNTGNTTTYQNPMVGGNAPIPGMQIPGGQVNTIGQGYVNTNVTPSPQAITLEPMAVDLNFAANTTNQIVNPLGNGVNGMGEINYDHMESEIGDVPTLNFESIESLPM